MKSVVLKPCRESSWHFGHPWIFSRALSDLPSVESGELVEVYSFDRKFLGIGTCNPQQSIAVRMLTRSQEVIDDQWCLKLFKKQLSYRKMLLCDKTTAFRLCYGESDGFAGLVVDLYDSESVVQINTKGVERLMPHISSALAQLGYSVHLTSSLSGEKEGVKITPADRKIVWAQESGYRIAAMLGGQKTGWFCDLRSARGQIAEWITKSRAKSVLNLFSHSGGFALYGLAAGASQIVNVDRDKKALDLGEDMLKANHLSGGISIQSDIWDYLRNDNDQYDLVIVDPPAFAKEKAKKEAALKGYKDLFLMALKRVKPGGAIALFSCSHHITQDDLAWVLRQVMAESGRFLQTVMRFSQGFDHPVPAFFPEGQYLKGFLLF